MRTLIDARLRAEAKQFDFRYTCEDCVHFVSEVDACANGYPTGAHLGIQLEVVESLEFCKEFELA